MTGAIAAVALLAAFSAPGVAALRRSELGLDRFEQIAFGAPLGMVVTALAMLVAAIASGFGPGVVLAVAGAGLVSAAVLWPWERAAARRRLAVLPIPGKDHPRAPRVVGFGTWARSNRWAVAVLAGFACWWAILWHGMVQWRNGALFGAAPIWGDWAQHIGDVTSFAYAGNVPPDFPRYAGHPYGYHYLASLTAAAMVEVGASPTTALTLHSWALSVFIALGVYAFARRVIGDGAAAALTVVLFFLGGNLGWLIVARDADNRHSLWDTLIHHPWDSEPQQVGNFLWQNVYFVSIAPQRGYLYGLPLMLLVLTLLFGALKKRQRRLFAAAGLVAGLLPFAHLGPLPALALIAAGLSVAFPSRAWLWFFGPWIALTLPQLYLQQGGQQGTLGGIQWHVGWLASPDPWWWFWLKNLGWFIPLVVIAFVDRRIVPPLARRFLWSFMPIFAIANLIVFQPDPWDNLKLLDYWFLAICVLAAAAVTATWREGRALLIRCLLVAAVATMTLSGILHNVQANREQYLWLTPEEVRLAQLIRDQTPADAVFAVGLQPNHPVPMLSGRSVVLSYPGWFWPRGIDIGPTERDLQAIYSLDPATPDLIRRHHISYLVIGPWERANFHPDEAAFKARYPLVISTQNYAVFLVSP